MAVAATAGEPGGAPGIAAMLTSRGFRDVWLVTIGHTLTHWYPATFYLLLPVIGSELGLTYGQIGSILTCQAAVSAISNIPGGVLVDSIPRKGLLLAVSLFWVGFPYLLMSFTSAYWMLLVCAALVGIGNNLWHPSAIPLLAKRFPDAKGLVVALHGMGGNVGDAVAPLVAGTLLAVMSWRGVVVANVIPGILVSVMIFLLLGNTTSSGAKGGHAAAARATRRPENVVRALVALLSNRTLLMLSIGSAFRSMTQSTLLTFLPLYLARELGYSPAWVGACLFAMQAAGIAATPVAGHLSDKMGRRSIVGSSMAMTAVIVALMIVSGHSQAFVMLVAFLGFFLFAIRSVLQAWLLDNTPAGLGGTSIGMLFAMQSVGTAIGPLLAGLLSDRFGLGAAFYFIATTIIAANLLIYFTPVQAEAGAAKA